jgi:hypothetical protein
VADVRTVTATRSGAHPPLGREGARSIAGFVRSGAVAGLVSVVTFTWIHDLLISDIWFALVPMLVAGALCGACVTWTYGLLFPAPSTGGWLRYNLAYLGLFVALGAVSVAVFDPVATVSELMAMDGPPDALIGQALPLTAAFVAVATALVTWLFGGSWRHAGPVLVTVGVLVLFLGLNVSIIGLVEFGAGELYLVAELIGLIVVINAVFAAAFLALERRRLTVREHRPAQAQEMSS